MPSIYARIKHLINRMTSTGSEPTIELPGIAVTIQEGNQPPRNLVSGVSNIQTNSSVTSKSLFEIGSTTKTYTATLILQLEQQQKLRISDTLTDISRKCSPNKYVDQLKDLVKQFPFLESITLHQLLTHTSGLKDYGATKAYTDVFAFDRYYEWTMVKLISIAAAENQGKQTFHYANTNFTLLGLIAEAIENKPFNEILHAQIIDKLGLTETYYLPAEQDKVKSRIVNGYEWYDPTSQQPTQDYQGFIAQQPARPVISNYRNSNYSVIDATLATNPTWGGLGDGGIVATTEDTEKFAYGLFHGKILNREIFASMLGGKDHQHLVKTNFGFKDVEVFYGLGIYYLKASNGLNFWGMMGDEYGYQGGVFYFPIQGSLKEEIIVSYSFNIDSPTALKTFVLELIKIVALKNQEEAVVDDLDVEEPVIEKYELPWLSTKPKVPTAASTKFIKNFPTPQPKDFSKESMTQAFLQMWQKIATEYAFTQHKGIIWSQLKNKYLPFIETAEKNNDKEAYYKTLRRFMLELHDTHSIIMGADSAATNFVTKLTQKSTNGSYGLIISATDDGKYIASYVAPNSPAANAGIQTGAEIIEWNKQPLAHAIKNSDILLSDELDPSLSYSPSTQASLNYEKLRMLVRGEVGTQANISWRNLGEHAIKNVTLSAIDDQGIIANKTKIFNTITHTSKRHLLSDLQPNSNTQITLHDLPNGYLHLKILDLNDGVYQASDKDEKKSRLYQHFVEIMQAIQDKNPPGVIVDLRGNTGGDGRLGLDFASFFSPKTATEFAIHVDIYDTATKKYQRAPLGPYAIDHQEPHYSGPVVVLTDIGTLSAAEWTAWSFQRIGKKLLSFYPSTQGAFAGSEPLIKMPGDFEIMYSMIRAYDENGELLGDSNAQLEGGIKTDVLIPFDAETAIAIYMNGEDRALSFAVDYLKRTYGLEQTKFPLIKEPSIQDDEFACGCDLSGWVKQFTHSTAGLFEYFSLFCCEELSCEEQPQNDDAQTNAALLQKHDEAFLQVKPKY